MSGSAAQPFTMTVNFVFEEPPNLESDTRVYMGDTSVLTNEQKRYVQSAVTNYIKQNLGEFDPNFDLNNNTASLTAYVEWLVSSG